MDKRLSGKSIVVTGAASGIGRAIADRCIDEGAMVLYTDRDESGAVQAAGGSGSEDKALGFGCDILKKEDVVAAISHALETFGHLDGVVANAGGGVDFNSNLVDVKEEDWLKVVDLNLSGTFRTLQAGAKALIEGGRGGVLLATGSSTAIRPLVGQYAYMASKAGIHQLVRGLAVELGPHKIRVNAIAPGVTNTPAVQAFPEYIDKVEQAVPLSAVIPPQEIGALGGYLLSDETLHMTGSIISLDAGRTVS